MRQNQEKLIRNKYLERIHRIDNVPISAVNCLHYTRDPKPDLIAYWENQLEQTRKPPPIFVDENFLVIGRQALYIVMRKQDRQTCSVCVMAGMIDTQLYNFRCRLSYSDRDNIKFEESMAKLGDRTTLQPQDLMNQSLAAIDLASSQAAAHLDISAQKVKSEMQTLMDRRILEWSEEQEPHD